MAVLTDPRYQNLAAIAAAGLGAGPNVHRAILAQFACEKAGEWPPQDNNPGNVHVGPMHDVGWTLPHGRGDSGAVAFFPSPENGASGYAAYIGRHPLYPNARAAIAADDGNAYIAAVTAVGYGTSRSCWQSNYGPAAPAGGTWRGDPGFAPRPTTSPAAGTADQWNAAIACFTAKHPTGVTRTAPTLSAAQLPDLVACASANGIAVTLAQLQPYVGKSLSDVRDGLAAAGVIPPADLGRGIVPDVAGAVNTAVATAIGAVVPLVIGIGVVLVVVMLAAGGTRDVLG